MKVVSFNVNGLRARLHQLKALVEKHQPDIIGLQEIKVHDDEFPRADVESLGYHVAHHGQKGHYGVALLSRENPLAVQKGFPGDSADAQRRFIAADYTLSDGSTLRVMNGYFPQGENRDHPEKFPAKEKYYADLNDYLNGDDCKNKELILMGDMNVAPDDADIGIGDANAKRWLRTGKCCFLPEEREWLSRLMAVGFVDSFRSLHPDVDDRFSWFDYRSRGFLQEPKRGLRIDLILSSEVLNERLVNADIDYELREMDRPSDHAPIWSEYDVVIKSQ